jgi:hypothetical protein
MAVTVALFVFLAGLVGLLIWMRRQDATGSGSGEAAKAPAPEPDTRASGSNRGRDGRVDDRPHREEAGAADELLDKPATGPTRRSSARAAAAPGPADVADPKPLGGRASDDHNAVQTNAKHCLVGVTGSVKDKVYAVGERTVTVGRLPNNFIQLDDGDVSRVHCQLRGGVDQLQLMAMETANGTRLNDKLVEAHSLHTLKDGDLLEVGRSVLMYRQRASATEVEADSKSRGVGTEAATAMVGGKKWADRVRSELARHGGDVEDTARTLGIEESVLEHMISQLGIE